MRCLVTSFWTSSQAVFERRYDFIVFFSFVCVEQFIPTLDDVDGIDDDSGACNCVGTRPKIDRTSFEFMIASIVWCDFQSLKISNLCFWMIRCCPTDTWPVTKMDRVQNKFLNFSASRRLQRLRSILASLRILYRSVPYSVALAVRRMRMWWDSNNSEFLRANRSKIIMHMPSRMIRDPLEETKKSLDQKWLMCKCILYNLSSIPSKIHESSSKNTYTNSIYLRKIKKQLFVYRFLFKSQIHWYQTDCDLREKMPAWSIEVSAHFL